MKSRMRRGTLRAEGGIVQADGMQLVGVSEDASAIAPEFLVYRLSVPGMPVPIQYMIAGEEQWRQILADLRDAGRKCGWKE